MGWCPFFGPFLALLSGWYLDRLFTYHWGLGENLATRAPMAFRSLEEGNPGAPMAAENLSGNMAARQLEEGNPPAPMAAQPARHNIRDQATGRFVAADLHKRRAGAPHHAIRDPDTGRFVPNPQRRERRPRSTLRDLATEVNRGANLLPTYSEKNVGRHESPAGGQAHHFQPYRGQPRRDSVRFSAKTESKLAARAGLPRPDFRDRPDGRAGQQLPRAKRFAGLARQNGCEIFGPCSAGNCRLRHLQNLRGPFPPETTCCSRAFRA